MFGLVCLSCWRGMGIDLFHAGCTTCPHCGVHEHGTRLTCEETR